MAGSDAGWLSASSIHRPSEDGFSWATRISRTCVSTVDGLNITESVASGTIQSLQGVLQAVQRLKIKRIPYDEIEEVHQIGHGETFEVLQCRFSGNVVAVKHIKISDSTTSSGQHQFRRRLQSVMKEVSIMHHAPLKSHPNIMNLLGHGWRILNEQPAPYVVVEYGSKGSLRHFLASTSQNLRSKMILGGDVACGLMALHSCGIVHGDLKLDNVVLFSSLDRPSGSIAKICDFGHSVFLGDESQEVLRYYGTTLYNAPEVSSQASSPIAREDLHKCDIWAYGLLLWEILLDGSRFFRREWRRDPQLVRSLDTALSSSGQDLQPGSRINNSTLGTADVEDDTVFGHFDSRHLHTLAKNYVNSIVATNAEFEKGYLRSLFNRTLQSDPKLRLSDLTKSPIVSRHWNKTASTTALQATMAIRTGGSGFTYDVFQRDNPHHIVWAHETQMLRDLETVCNSSQQLHIVQPALFHTALCYMNGFGTSSNDTKASQYMQKAEEQGHVVACLLWPRLRSVVGRLSTHVYESYPSLLRRGFSEGRCFLHPVSFQCSWSTSIKAEAVLHQTHADYATFSTAARLYEVPSAVKVLVNYASLVVSMNLLEVAIAFSDVRLVSDIVYNFDLFSKGCWNENALEQAARHGNLAMILLLVQKASTRSHPSPDHWKASMLHWLFCLPDSGSMEEILNSLSITTGLLNAIIPVSYSLHPQWPVKLEGTPLAVAVIVGDERVVKILLDCGADPLSPALAKGSGGEGWTPLHLAVRYHQPVIFGQLWSSITQPMQDTQPLERFPLPCALSYCTVAERLVIHGNAHCTVLRQMLSLPLGQLHARSSLGRTSLLQAIDFEDYDVVNALLNQQSNLAETPLRDPNNARSFTYPLHFAAQIGSHRDTDTAVKIVERLLMAAPHMLSERNGDGSTALHMAVTGASCKITEFLLTNGASTAVFDHKGRSALHNCRDASNIKVFLDHGGEIEMRTATSGTAMHSIAYAGLVEPICELLRRGASIDAWCDSIGSVLHAAIRGRSHTMVDTLLANGAGVNTHRDFDGRTALMLAIELRLTKIAWSLIDAGADCSAKNKQGISTFYLTLKSGILPLINKIGKFEMKNLSRAEWATILHDTAQQPGRTILQTLLQLKHMGSSFSIDASIHQTTPLHAAAQLARTDTMEVLLAHGADVHALDTDFNTPILLACRGTPHVELGSSRSKACMLLVTNGADILDVDDKDNNCLSLAQRAGDFELMTMLVDIAANEDGPRSKTDNAKFDKDRKMCLTLLCEKADPISESFSLAMEAGEWDFVTVCISRGLIDDEVLIQRFDFPRLNLLSTDELLLLILSGDKQNIWKFTLTIANQLRVLKNYAHRSDRNMIKWAAGGSEYRAGPTGWTVTDSDRSKEWRQSIAEFVDYTRTGWEVAFGVDLDDDKFWNHRKAIARTLIPKLTAKIAQREEG